MTLAGVLGIPGLFGWIAVVLMGAFWFILTVFILCIMEVRLTPLRAEAASFGFRLLTAPFFRAGPVCLPARTASALGGSEQ